MINCMHALMLSLYSFSDTRAMQIQILTTSRVLPVVPLQVIFYCRKGRTARKWHACTPNTRITDCAAHPQHAFLQIAREVLNVAHVFHTPFPKLHTERLRREDSMDATRPPSQHAVCNVAVALKTCWIYTAKHIYTLQPLHTNQFGRFKCLLLPPE